MQKGFSLIELLIVLTIIGVLSAMGYPSFRDYLTRAHRIDGQSALIELACRMETYHMQNKTYQTATIGTGTKTDVLRHNITSEGWYRLSINHATDTRFSLQATPIKTQAINDTLCQSLTLDSLGVQGIAAGPAGRPTSSSEHCW